MTCQFFDEYFGTHDQQNMQRRALAFYDLAHGDYRFTTHGRTIGLAEFTDNPAEHVALAKLLGVGISESVPSSKVAKLVALLEESGFQTDCYNNWRGGQSALSAARDVLDCRSLPDDLEIRIADVNTDPAEMQAIAQTTQSCDVLLPSGAFMRGLRRDAVCLYAVETGGRIVGTSASVSHRHPDHPKGQEAWWGMLSTVSDRRGQSIALVLGAKALILMRERFGTENFVTGIREGNAASEYLCAKLGLHKADNCSVLAIDPAAFEGGQMTK